MDRKSALAKLTKEGYLLRDMPQYMNDKELVLAAVKDYGLSLKHASPALQGDRQVVMAAVKNNGMAIDYASPALKKDKVIVKAAAAQEKALDDAMTKKYFKKGGRTRRTRV
jgi:phosphosulfolactate phosphohydrolase-like enzyme